MITLIFNIAFTLKQKMANLIGDLNSRLWDW